MQPTQAIATNGVATGGHRPIAGKTGAITGFSTAYLIFLTFMLQQHNSISGI
jgi:hypothetical protein